MTQSMTHRSTSGTARFLVIGAVLLIAGNVAHPLDAEPTAVSRLELATGAAWIPIHLALAIGFLLVTVGLIRAGRDLRLRGGDSWADLGSTAGLAGGLLLFAVFGAFDGFAVSSLADRWAAAPGDQLVQAAAIAEEAVDSGLAGIGTLAFFGLAIGALGAAMLSSGALARWVGWSGVVIGAAGTVAGVMLVVQGPTAFTINVVLRPVAIAGTLWFVALAAAVRGLGAGTAAEPAAGRVHAATPS